MADDDGRLEAGVGDRSMKLVRHVRELVGRLLLGLAVPRQVESEHPASRVDGLQVGDEP